MEIWRRKGIMEIRAELWIGEINGKVMGEKDGNGMETR